MINKDFRVKRIILLTALTLLSLSLFSQQQFQPLPIDPKGKVWQIRKWSYLLHPC